MDEVVKSNKLRTILSGAASTLALLCCSGPIMQTFLASLGFPSRFIYIHTVVLQAVHFLTICLASRWADHGNAARRMAAVLAPQALLYLCYLPLCVWRSASLTSFLLLTGINVLQNIALGLTTVCDYKLPYVLYGPKDYASVVSISGIISAALSFGSGLLISRLTRWLGYAQLMFYGCMVSAALTALSALLHFGQKPVLEQPEAGRQRQDVPLRDVFLHPMFLRLIPGNLLRGYAGGALSVMAVIVLDLGFSAETATSLVWVQAAASLTGSMLFGLAAQRISSCTLFLAGSLPFAALPLILHLPDSTAFLAIYTVIYVGRVVTDYAVPNVLRLAVPMEIAGPYHAWRMVLFTLGMILATSTAAAVSAQVLMLLCAAAQILAALNYFLQKDLRSSTIPDRALRHGRHSRTSAP